MAKFYVDTSGRYIGSFDGVWVPGNPDAVWLFPEVPEGAIEVPEPPDDAGQIWSDGEWGPLPIVVPKRVTSRRFKLQMLEPILPQFPSGIIDVVESWVATQPRAVQISYNNSSEFDRTQPMMQAGFAALGFTDPQIDAFFVAADKIA